MIIELTKPIKVIRVQFGLKTAFYKIGFWGLRLASSGVLTMKSGFSSNFKTKLKDFRLQKK